MYSSAKVAYKGETNDSVTLEELNDLVFYRLHIPAVIFVALCIFIGIIGNLLVLTIYKTRFRRSNHRYFILFLGVVDLLACVTGMPFLIASLRLPYMMTSVIACKVIRCIHYAVNNSSGLLLVVISMERYRKICRPFKKQFSHQQTLSLCIGTVLLSVLISIPSAVFYGDNTIHTGVDNITGTQCYIADKYTGNRYFETYMAFLLLETFICIIVFAVLYTFIIRKLWASDQFIETMRSIQKKASKTDKQDKPHSTDELNSVEDSFDSKFESVHEKEQNNCTMNNVKVGNAAHNTSDENYQGTEQEARLDGFSSTSTVPKTEKEIDNSLKKSDLSDSTAGDINGGSRTGFGRKLSPVQKQIYEKLFTKQTLEKDSKQSHSTRKNSKTTARVTVMLFTVTMVFVMAFVPHLTLMILTIEMEWFVDSMTVTQIMVYHVFLRIFIINNVANPIVYFIFDVKFRTLCKSFFRKCCRSRSVSTK